jgi:hypothetical protein
VRYRRNNIHTIPRKIANTAQQNQVASWRLSGNTGFSFQISDRYSGNSGGNLVCAGFSTKLGMRYEPVTARLLAEMKNRPSSCRYANCGMLRSRQAYCAEGTSRIKKINKLRTRDGILSKLPECLSLQLIA